MIKFEVRNVVVTPFGHVKYKLFEHGFANRQMKLWKVRLYDYLLGRLDTNEILVLSHSEQMAIAQAMTTTKLFGDDPRYVQISEKSEAVQVPFLVEGCGADEF